MLNIPQQPPDDPPPTYETIIISAFGLEPSSSPADIKAVLTQVVAAKLSPIESSKVLETAAAETKVAKKVLEAELKQLTQQALVSTDPAFIVAQTLLAEEFNGTHLRRGVDGQYWRYVGTHWQPTTDTFVNSRLQAMAISMPYLTDGKRSLSALVSSAKACLTARHIYGKKFSFVTRALVVMAGNSYPTTNDVSYGMIRRANVFPFDASFKEGEADPTLFPTIWETELPGVLNRAIAGLKRLRQRKGFKVPEACEDAFHEFLTHAMPLLGFIVDRWEYDPDGRVLLSEFRAALKDWAKHQGITKVPTDKTLKRKLLGQDIKVAKVKGYETIFGLKLSAPEVAGS